MKVAGSDILLYVKWMVGPKYKYLTESRFLTKPTSEAPNETYKCILPSLVLRPLPDYISQPWRMAARYNLGVAWGRGYILPEMRTNYMYRMCCHREYTIV